MADPAHQLILLADLPLPALSAAPFATTVHASMGRGASHGLSVATARGAHRLMALRSSKTDPVMKVAGSATLAAVGGGQQHRPAGEVGPHRPAAGGAGEADRPRHEEGGSRPGSRRIMGTFAGQAGTAMYRSLPSARARARTGSCGALRI